MRQRLRLSDIVGRRVKLTKKGKDHFGLCPFHNEKSPSFSLNDEKGFYHCFGCGAHGDMFKFLMETQGVGFREALEKLAGDAGVVLTAPSPEAKAMQEKKSSLLDVTEAACGVFEKNLRSGAGRAAYDYLRGRGFTDATIEKFRLGFAPDERYGLKNNLLQQNITPEQLVETGLVIQPEQGDTYDRFRGRVMFPILDVKGQVIAFGGRILGAGEPKYLNSPDTPLFHKGEVLYNFSHARASAHQTGKIIAVEGYTDVIALSQAGIENVVAPLGTAFTEDHIRLIWRAGSTAILCFDGDQAGQRAADRVVDRALPILRPDRELRFLTLPKGEDPDSFVQKNGVDGFKNLMVRSQAFVDRLMQKEMAVRDITTPEARADLQKRLLDARSKITDPNLREAYQIHLRQKMDQFFGLGKKFMPARSVGGRGVMAGNFAQRQDYAMLAVLINHQDVLEELMEQVGMLHFDDSQLDQLRQNLLQHWEADQLIDHLTTQGFGALLAEILSPDVAQLFKVVDPACDKAKVRQWWLDVFDRVQQKQHVVPENDDLLTEDGWAAFVAAKQALGGGEAS